ncbi:MAG: ribulose-phosphate 3-epimerase [Armatimonadota bacterium]|nr:ribulose-phosphate 3-epimerase [Armatimonadota bacterium]MDR5696663.1 ribulose-phosphate 3-epimerase [Armatimonadota bacterium]
MIRIAPSILSADFGRLREQVAEAEAGGADWIHVDVMDGRFVPNLTIGPAVVEAVRAATRLPLDVHLMVEEPDGLVPAFCEVGADRISVHVEACVHLQRSLARIRELGAVPGVALNPHTPPEAVKWVLGDVGTVLVMTVNPGFGGQAFLPAMTDKIRRFARLRARLGLGFEIEVDGGIETATARLAVGGGATVLVAGQSVYRHPDGVAAGISAIRRAAASEIARSQSSGL